MTFKGDPNDRLRMFLSELAVLRQEYGLEVGGCGECGSPWVRDVDVNDNGSLHGPDPPGQVGRFLWWDGNEYVFRQGSILGGWT